MMRSSTRMHLSSRRASLVPANLVAVTVLAASSLTCNAAEPEAIPLWPDGAAGSVSRMNEPEKVDRRLGKCNVTNVHHPSITPYLPTDDVATGTAVIIAPGGGHHLNYKEAGVPCELHIYSNAGHGFGYRPNTTTAAGDWPLRLREWLVDSQLLVGRADRDSSPDAK